ncbi:MULTISPECIES: metallophosphoesterase [unclassified Frondihabitans]|uniref:metallophosphoesterase family protein n=1 Tax=unclassified Frondihabitans TaxID=2626248 RepID=UPI000F516A13|nr:MULTISPECIES: metallophosphoesterase [unclassified Frondihabitans]
MAVAGDWHNDRTWIMNVFSRISTAAPDVRVILQLGDLEIGTDKYAKAFLNFIDERCRGHNIDYVLVTPGNHDDRDRLDAKQEWRRGEPTPLSEHVLALPPGYRFGLGGRSVLSFGTGASVQDDLVKGVNWWPQEVPAPGLFDAAAALGHVDILLTHEAVLGGPASVAAIINGRASKRWRPERLAASARSRELISGLCEAVDPAIVFHGHMHVRGQTEPGAPRRIYSLADNRSPGNAGILTMATLDFQWI